MTTPSPGPRRRGATPRHRAGRTGARLARFVVLLVAVAVVVVAVVGRFVLDNPLDATDATAANVEGEIGSTSRPTGSADTATPSATVTSTTSPTTSPGSSTSRSTRNENPPRIPEDGPGTFRTAGASPRDTSDATTYRVEVEHGLPYTPGEVARTVQRTLSDPRSWNAHGDHRLVRVDGEADLRILLASPTTVDELCAPLDTGGRVSCRNGENVVLNAWRWRNGADGYEGDIEGYRRYLINHETGHALGYGHVECPGAGELAPVMLQQTLGLDGCRPNPWPARVDLR